MKKRPPGRRRPLSFAVCTGCACMLPETKFGIDKHRSDGSIARKSQCKHCRTLASRAWRQANPDKVSEYNRRWDQQNPERRRELGRQVDAQRSAYRNAQRRGRSGRRWTKDEVVAVYGSDCHICGESIDLTLKWPAILSFSIDHVIALARGGTNDFDNLRPAHLTCNVSKGPRPLADAVR